MEMFRHEVSAWTVGQLRKALADFPDDMPLRVAPLEEPGGELEAPLQVVTNAEIRVFADASEGARPALPGPVGGELPGDYVTLECDFPSGEYYQEPD
ncbi:MAG TPA: DUF6225 family protein [Streptosporangiaceae bacterium]|jgi:hypothetical protein|nr:DUF6225 family protein [Streptosporangiaceae bacterium]